MAGKKTAKKSVAKKARTDLVAEPKTRSCCVQDEEVALRMVKLYFEEVARLGFKRTLDLDAIINAYFYSLARLKRKDKEIELIKAKVLKEEIELEKETKEELFPEPQN
jgi:hypothetical protein